MSSSSHRGNRQWRSSPVAGPPRPPEPSGSFAVAVAGGVGAGFMVMAAIAALTDRSLSPLTWYLARASGFTLFLLLWASVALGLGITTKLLDQFMSRSVVYSLHTFVTQLSFGFLALHLMSLAVDTHAPFTVLQMVVPFSSQSKEPWTGFGVLAMELLVLVAASGIARRYITFRGWKSLHMLALPLFALSLGHGLGAGTDSSAPWATALYLVAGLSVLWLLLYRIIRWNRRAETPEAMPSSPPHERFEGRGPAIQPAGESC